MKREEDFKATAAQLNLLRKANGGTFSTGELKALLKGIIPTDCSSMVTLVDTNIVIRVHKGLYSFPGNPIPWTSVRNFYKQSRERSTRYRKSTTRPVSYEELDRMIKILKGQGFLVFKPM